MSADLRHFCILFFLGVDIRTKMIDTLKKLIGNSGGKSRGYSCSECETSFSVPEGTPVECPECESPESVFPDRNIVLKRYRCNDCNGAFAFPDGVDVACPDCESTSVRTVT